MFATVNRQQHFDLNSTLRAARNRPGIGQGYITRTEVWCNLRNTSVHTNARVAAGVTVLGNTVESGCTNEACSDSLKTGCCELFE